MYLAKIVSGGQTGVDRGALEAAVKVQFPYGGMIPKGRLSEDGSVPAKFECMIESDTEDYRFRTRWNVEHSDATLILSFAQELEGGTQRTRQYCMNVRKPFFTDNPSSPKMTVIALPFSNGLRALVPRTAASLLSSTWQAQGSQNRPA